MQRQPSLARSPTSPLQSASAQAAPLLGAAHSSTSPPPPPNAGPIGGLLWFIGVEAPPGPTLSDKTQEATLVNSVQALCDKQKAHVFDSGTVTSLIHHACVVNVPRFQITTLDALVSLLDELTKIDSDIETAVSKHVASVKSLCSDMNVDYVDFLLVNDKLPHRFLREFNWNSRQFRGDVPLATTVLEIHKTVLQAEGLMKARFSHFSQLRGQKKALERKKHGNLATCSLVGIVKAEHVVPQSEYITSAFVAVPNVMVSQWESTYEHLNDMVVPRTAAKICSDNEYTLYSVVVFLKARKEFETRCREQRFIPRDYKHDDVAIEQLNEEMQQICAQEKENLGRLLYISRTTFQHYLIGLCHIKAIRIHVESILRYGLQKPVVTLAVEPIDRLDKRALAAMSRLFATGGRSRGPGDMAIEEQLGDLSLQVGSGLDREYYPFPIFGVDLRYI